MARYEVDVKAFINIEVEADSDKSARQVADAFVENALSANELTVLGYNEGIDENSIGFVIPGDYSLSVDGQSDVEEIS